MDQLVLYFRRNKCWLDAQSLGKAALGQLIGAMALVHQAHIVARLSCLGACITCLIIMNIGAARIVKPLVAASKREVCLIEPRVMLNRLLEGSNRAIDL